MGAASNCWIPAARLGELRLKPGGATFYAAQEPGKPVAARKTSGASRRRMALASSAGSSFPMRKRTFMDKSFSVGNANSDAYRDNWDAVFGDSQAGGPTPQTSVGTGGETPDPGKDQPSNN